MATIKYLDKNLELIIMGILLAVFTVLMFLNVVLRYCFGLAIVWGDELCRYCLVASTFFSIPLWVHRRSGIRVDAVVSLLPKRVQKIGDIAVYGILLVFFLYLFVSNLGVYQNMAESGQVSSAMQMPTKYLYIVVGIGFFLAVVRTMQVLVELLRGFHQADEAKGGEAK